MRKNILRIVACAMAMTLSFSLFACGKDEDKDAKAKTEESSNSDADTDSEEDTDSDADNSSDTDDGSDADNSSDTDNASGDSKSSEDKKTEKYESIEAYLNDESIKIQMEAMTESLEGTGMTMEVSADGNKLVYRYTFTDIEKEEGMDQTLKSSLESQASSFSKAAASIKEAVDVDNPILVIEYADANGELILSQEFTAE